MTRADDMHLESEQILVTGVPFVSLAGMAFLLRFLARMSDKTTFGWDDLWVVLGLFL